MNELLAQLHNARTSLESIASDRKKRQNEFNSTPTMVELMRAEAKWRDEAELARQAVEDAALEKYSADKIKTNPGYVVSETTEAEIKDAVNLREWVIENSPIMMVVDTKQILSVAKSDNNSIPAELVEVKKVEKVKISSSLGEFVKE